jgi:hypothetical protein
MFPGFKLDMFAVYGPHSWFLTQSKETVSWSNLVFFLRKGTILTILFIVKYEKITPFDEFFVLLGPIIIRFFACSNEENKGCLLWSYLYGVNATYWNDLCQFIQQQKTDWLDVPYSGYCQFHKRGERILVSVFWNVFLHNCFALDKCISVAPRLFSITLV